MNKLIEQKKEISDFYNKYYDEISNVQKLIEQTKSLNLKNYLNKYIDDLNEQETIIENKFVTLAVETINYIFENKNNNNFKIDFVDDDNFSFIKFSGELGVLIHNIIEEPDHEICFVYQKEFRDLISKEDILKINNKTDFINMFTLILSENEKLNNELMILSKNEKKTNFKV